MDWYQKSKSSQTFWLLPDGDILDARFGHDVAVMQNPKLFNITEPVEQNEAKSQAISRGFIACKIAGGNNDILAVWGLPSALTSNMRNILAICENWRTRRIVNGLDVNFLSYTKEDFEEKYSSSHNEKRYGQTTMELPVWDAKDGIGAVPHNQEVDYRGFVKLMTPAEFRKLVPAGSWGNAGQSMAEAAKKGVTFGPPFLAVKWEEKKRMWRVMDHEGRSRSDASEILSPGKQMPVHIFPIGFRARDLDEEMKSAPFIPQGGK